MPIRRRSTHSSPRAWARTTFSTKEHRCRDQCCGQFDWQRYRHHECMSCCCLRNPSLRRTTGALGRAPARFTILTRRQFMAETDLTRVIRKMFERNGASLYGGEDVTQLEHALQAAALAELEDAPSSLVVAALLHD